MKIQIINGPNLNLLGKREPETYGKLSFEEYFEKLKARFPDVDLHYYQSNVEGELINKLHEVGFDFDGVIMYNPARIIRPFMAFLKLKKVVKRKHLQFYQPHGPIMRWLWWLAHQSSFMPARGLDRIKELSLSKKIDAYVITGRNTQLKPDLMNKLAQLDAQHMFLKCYITHTDEQPHEFKEKMIKKLKLKVYIEDNWDIVQYLDATCGDQCEILWVYNWLDHNIPYPRKVSSLKEAIKYIEDKYVTN